jgi:hypothetical protein
LGKRVKSAWPLAALDQDLAVARVGIADVFLVAAPQLVSMGTLAVERLDDLIRFTVP